MMRSTHRILTTNAGSLPRPDDVRTLVTAKAGGQPYAEDALVRRVRSAVRINGPAQRRPRAGDRWSRWLA